jgi:hypothetical protein
MMARISAVTKMNTTSRKALRMFQPLLVIALLFLAMHHVEGQGAVATVNFNNRVPIVGLYAPIYALEVGGTLLAGTDYLAQLYAGPVGTATPDLKPIGDAVGFRQDVAGFLNVGVDGSRSITDVGPGQSALVQIRVWSAAAGSTYEQALLTSNPTWLAGVSDVLTVTTTSSLADPIPAPLTGLQSFAVVPVPEPDIAWFGSLGLIALMLKMRFSREDRA